MTGSRRGFWAEERLTFWKDRYSCWVESTLQGLRAETARPVSKLLHIPDSESAGRDKVTAAEAVRRGQILARSTLERLQDLPLNWLWGMRERQESRTTPRLLPWVAIKGRRHLLRQKDWGKRLGEAWRASSPWTSKWACQVETAYC